MSMTVEEAKNLARAAKAINAEERDIPANAALVVLLRHIVDLETRICEGVCNFATPCGACEACDETSRLV